MPTAHIDAEGNITLIDPGTPEDAIRAEEGLQEIIAELATMVITRLSAEERAIREGRSTDQIVDLRAK